MEATNYTSIGPVLQLNKAGELAQKRMKAVKVCDGLYITEPDKRDFVRYIIECNGVMWVESTQSKSYAERYAAAMPEALKKVKAGFYSGENRNNYCREIDRRINHPDSPAIMELKKPERKKAEPLAENERKVSVLMFKGCTGEMTEKKVVITEVAPHVYTYAYKQKRYGERVKIIFEIDGVYFQGHDTGTYVLEREDFTEVCTKAYELARQNVADGAASGTAYFVEVQKRIDAATSEQVDAPEVSAPQYDTTAEVAAKIMAYLPEVCKWQDDGDRTNALILKFMQPTNAYHGFNGSDFVELAGLIGFTIEKKWRDRITKYVHTFQAHRAISCPQQSGVYGDMYTRPRHDTMAGIYTIADAFMRRLLWLLERWSENQPATPAETPRISTEAAETVNVSGEGEKAEKTANLNDETRRYIIDTFKTKENLIAKFMDAIKSDNAELDEYKANTRKGGKFRKERMQRLEDSATELAKQMEEWSAVFDEPLPIEEPHDHITIYQTALEQCEALADNPEIMLREDVARVERKDGKTARIIATNFDDGFLHCPLYFVVYVDEIPMLEDYATLETAIESAKTDIPTNPFGVSQPPQSPETPQTVECTTDTPKPREMARKPQNRAIGNTCRSGLGANGYAMLDNANATLTAMCVPRECSTADVAHW